MKVSIITATYNSAATVADTLHSVQKQTYPAIEHIIIDGLSNDNTLQIVSGFNHVQQVVSEKDTGIYDAMNKGITYATGDIIGILNSDDFYPGENIIEEVVSEYSSERGFDGLDAKTLKVKEMTKEERLIELKGLYKKKLLTKEVYDGLVRDLLK